MLAESNEYPIVFIGAGMSKRFLDSYPGWIELLQEYWNKIESEDFYAKMNKIKEEIKREINIEENQIDFQASINMGTIIENKFNEKFYNSKIEVSDFDQKKAYQTGISPFKQSLANRFSALDYKIGEKITREIMLFQKVLNKSQIIITTNYDTNIENLFSGHNLRNLRKYIGQNGLFNWSYNWGEIYKIHGCITKPDSIIISEDDYKHFDNNSVLISAKIISLLLHSPIIFFGYSLSDRNVRRIFKNFSSSLSPEERKILQDRIIIVERKEGEDDLKEFKMRDEDLGFEYTVIQTDNYEEVFEKLCNINQGVAPSEVRKYQDVIRELIIDRGKKGELKSLLVSPQDLDDLGSRISDENLVVALGDNAYIFKYPDLITYVEEYLTDQNSYNLEIILKFVANQAPNGRIPFFKYYLQSEDPKAILNEKEYQKLQQRIARHGEINQAIENMQNSNKIRYSSLSEIIEENYSKEKEMHVIAYNIERINIEEIETYILSELDIIKEAGATRLSTGLRRLLVVHDIKKYKSD